MFWSMSLSMMGFSPHFESCFSKLQAPGLVPARATRVEGDRAYAQTERGEIVATLASRHRSGALRPVAGDWLAIDAESGLVREVLPRRSELVRKAAGRRVEPQVVAANADFVFVVMATDADFSPRRVERYLAAVEESRAEPVVWLTKAARCVDLDAKIEATARVASGAHVHAIDVVDGLGVDAPWRYLQPGLTAALVGSSGVGKSTLVNHLLGGEHAATGAVREADQKGRHTTTRRELFWLPNGAAVVDTPGMRELALLADEASVARTFDDVEAFASACRYRDCGHDREPGCAVRAAAERGDLEADRLASFLSLRAEVLAHERRRNEPERRAEGRRLSKAVRLAVKAKR